MIIEYIRCRVPDGQAGQLEAAYRAAEGHEQGFRHSPAFSEFFYPIRPLFESIEEMRHYQETSVASSTGSTDHVRS